MVMKSQGGIELVAELPQSPKKHGYRVRRRLPGPANAHSGIVGVSSRKPVTSGIPAGGA
jgi:hypothetical protein